MWELTNDDDLPKVLGDLRRTDAATDVDWVARRTDAATDVDWVAGFVGVLRDRIVP